MPSKPTALPTGVTRNGSGFQAKIRYNALQYNLGTFATVNHASAAYQEALDLKQSGENLFYAHVARIATNIVNRRIAKHTRKPTTATEPTEPTPEEKEIAALMDGMQAMISTYNNTRTPQQRLSRLKLLHQCALDRETKARYWYDRDPSPINLTELTAASEYADEYQQKINQLILQFHELST